MEQHLDLQLNKGLSAKEKKHSMQSEQTEGVQPRWRREENFPEDAAQTVNPSYPQKLQRGRG